MTNLAREFVSIPVPQHAKIGRPRPVRWIVPHGPYHPSLSRYSQHPVIRKMHPTQAVAKLDVLKFLLNVAWEVKDIDNKKYIALSEPLTEIGKMSGAWLGKMRQIQKQNSDRDKSRAEKSPG